MSTPLNRSTPLNKSTLLRKPAGSHGRVQHVTPENAGWTYVGFDVHKLAAGETVSGETGGREVCLVLVAGRATVEAGGQDFGTIGERMSPFAGKPWSVYVPAGRAWRVTAATDLELAVCSAPGGGAFEPRLIAPGDVKAETRGKGTNIRHVANILPEGEPAHSLLVVEVVTPPGHWSSYPPHKHDRDALPEESLLEETYYHRLDPAQGYALQRVYTDDRSLDETMAVEDGDVTLVPRGYHPVGAPHGYTLYYLNVMAGPRRTWKFHNDPAHAWILEQA
ncbi:5-deoxy-glucuronate isomerase [Chelatococcus sp. SYSU_G07232]|uniref:5-deoxy-glucuronate isomerase n=1 Tax=Chelatococcus albus TaxID=3047466 RepID=A0ABT7AIZ4_9HYPH|nr:5-deoxy-glucuronate isomerase [Chelatococcus sp. SYSU_G07232]MDJ1159070.1 5-deoxy-glucuronate isomerase [Chelatococcus sp. SYSU_G07232]